MFLHDCISTDKHSKYFSNPRILEYMDYVIVFCGIALSLRANKISENYLGFFPPSRGKGEKNHAQAVQLRMWSCKLEKQKEVGQCQKSGHCAYHIGFMHLVPAEGLSGSRRWTISYHKFPVQKDVQ